MRRTVAGRRRLLRTQADIQQKHHATVIARSGTIFQEIHQIFDAMGSVAVADVMGRRVVKTKFRGRDPVIHLLIGAGVSDPPVAGCDD